MSMTNILIILIYIFDFATVAIALWLAGICIYSIFEELKRHFGSWRK